MDRLTKRDKKGRAYFDNDGVLIRGANGTFHQKKDMTAQYIHDRFVALDKAIDLLAAYEDTGLEPQEIMAIISLPNPPLTLEELRKMDGEQIWIDQPDGSEDYNGWARVELAAPWKPGGLKPHVFVVSLNGDRDYAGLLLECGVKIYRYKPEEESR